MNRILLLSALFVFTSSLGFSQAINHVDYGNEGLVIGINENYAMDIDGDDFIDFYINSLPNELNFTPITGIGCFNSESYFASNQWGTQIIQIFNEGEVLSINDYNMWDYIDDDRGTTYVPGDGPAEGWVDGQETFIGFAVFSFSGVANGWMKVKMDVANETLIILEYAYHDFINSIDTPSIIVGDRGFVDVQDLDNSLSDISISPNPAQDIFSIDFNYSGQENIDVSILDNIGKEIYRRSGNNISQLTFDTSNWNSGLYLVNFNTGNGVHTERVIISH